MQHIILLRGLIRGQYHWSGFIEMLQQSLPECDIITIDIAGCGSRYKEASPSDIETAAEDLQQQLNNTGIKPPYNIVALSLGGMMTLQYLHDYGDESKAIIINTSHAGLSSTLQRMHWQGLVLLPFFVVLPLSIREKIIYYLTVNHQHSDKDDILSQWLSEGLAHPVSLKNLYRQLLLARSFVTDLRLEPENILICCSDRDRLVNSSCSKALARVYRLPINHHESAGHDVALDDSEWLISRIKKQFYAQH